MKIKIGDRVRYGDGEDVSDTAGTVVEPYKLEGDSPTTDVMVAWDDGERFWEDPASLVVFGGVQA